MGLPAVLQMKLFLFIIMWEPVFYFYKGVSAVLFGLFNFAGYSAPISWLVLALAMVEHQVTTICGMLV